MRIRFLQDYRGVLTDEEFFVRGQEVEHANGKALVEHGRAEALEPTPATGDLDAYAKGGGWYEIDGESYHGKKAAKKALEARG